MSSRAEQKEATRQRLIVQAVRLVGERGFGQTRTVDVAKAARVSHGTVFTHFPSREDLVLAVAGHIGRKTTDRLHELAGAGRGLDDVLQAHLQCLQENEDAYRQLVLEAPLLPAEFRATWVGLQSAVSSYVCAAAEAEAAEGRTRALPAHLVFNTWIGLVHHYLVNKDLFVTEGSVIAAHGPSLTEYFMTLLRT
ncbi:TetR/AcrR family transcriptional regulator [Streptomyces sp. NA02950]|uniref:TetR/AcrR family transcriptional regulator n=1 Tax=Streptomyces sp. NA02950 TaxID=2742137 RepID=UPI0015903131|nr:TetR/AcrR family transcriptional regulator [Streptomyces sp. NA02950]QKV90755.1 TetR/AcrR family transcriptional regulator [Streptomyces sp. NA02950]